jgi:hypothetical protein
MLHRTAQERYEKLKKVFARLMANFNRDDLDDYVLTANSLREWIRQDKTLMPEQRDHLEKFVVPESLDWQICNQVANAQKHVKAQPRSKKRKGAPPITTVTVWEVKTGGVGFFVPEVGRVFGAGDEILLDCDGKREDALAFVVRSFRHFHYIFELAPVPLETRVIPTLTDILCGRYARSQPEINGVAPV